MPSTMRAMVLDSPKSRLRLAELAIPQPGPNEILIRISVCGICRTDLHVLDGELTRPKLPLIPGHQIVGTVVELGNQVKNLKVGDRVGVPWLGGSCGHCSYCLSGKENLCDNAVYTGYQKDGGFAEYCTANSDFVFKLPADFSDLHVAPLLCAGLIGYRAYRMTENAQILGFYGFGSSAHILTQVARYQGKQVFAFTRKGDLAAQQLAKELGASWVGGSEEKPPQPLDAAIIFASDGSLVPKALGFTSKGGIVVCAGIHMSDIPSFPYSLLWEERQLRSVANLTRQDGRDFLALAPQIPIHTKVTEFPLEQANEALEALRHGTFTGSAVIRISNS